MTYEYWTHYKITAASNTFSAPFGFPELDSAVNVAWSWRELQKQARDWYDDRAFDSALANTASSTVSVVLPDILVIEGHSSEIGQKLQTGQLIGIKNTRHSFFYEPHYVLSQTFSPSRQFVKVARYGAYSNTVSSSDFVSVKLYRADFAEKDLGEGWNYDRALWDNYSSIHYNYGTDNTDAIIKLDNYSNTASFVAVAYNLATRSGFNLIVRGGDNLVTRKSGLLSTYKLTLNGVVYSKVQDPYDGYEFIHEDYSDYYIQHSQADLFAFQSDISQAYSLLPFEMKEHPPAVSQTVPSMTFNGVKQALPVLNWAQPIGATDANLIRPGYMNPWTLRRGFTFSDTLSVTITPTSVYNSTDKCVIAGWQIGYTASQTTTATMMFRNWMQHRVSGSIQGVAEPDKTNRFVWKLEVGGILTDKLDSAGFVRIPLDHNAVSRLVAGGGDGYKLYGAVLRIVMGSSVPGDIIQGALTNNTRTLMWYFRSDTITDSGLVSRTIPIDMTDVYTKSLTSSFSVSGLRGDSRMFLDIFLWGNSVYIDRNTAHTYMPLWGLPDLTTSVATYSSTATGVSAHTFDNTGKRYYEIDNDNGIIYQYSLSPSWFISSAVVTDKFTLSSTHAASLWFRSDGERLYVGFLGTNGFVRRYDLSSPFELSSISATTDEFSNSFIPTGISFKPDGTKAYILQYEYLREYSLGTSWHISTAALERTASITSYTSAARSLYMRDGGAFYFLGVDDATIRGFSLSTSWNISSRKYMLRGSSLSAVFSSPVRIHFTSGQYMAVGASSSVTKLVRADSIFNYYGRKKIGPDGYGTSYNISSVELYPLYQDYYGNLFVQPQLPSDFPQIHEMEALSKRMDIHGNFTFYFSNSAAGNLRFADVIEVSPTVESYGIGTNYGSSFSYIGVTSAGFEHRLGVDGRSVIVYGQVSTTACDAEQGVINYSLALKRT